MIVKMKKYSFLLFHKDYNGFLEHLRSLGLMHVKEKEGGVEDEQLDQYLQELARIDSLVKELKKLAGDQAPSTLKEGRKDALSLIEEFQSLVAEKEALLVKEQQLDKYHETLLPWGDFDISNLTKLEESGWNIHFYSCSDRDWDEAWEAQYDLVEIGHHGVIRYFIVVADKDQKVDIDADKVEIPEFSLSQVASEKEKLHKQLEDQEAKLSGFAIESLPVITAHQMAIHDKIDFKKVHLDGDAVAENHVYVLEGYVPESNMEKIDAFLNESNVYYEVNRPTMGEKVPVLLKNNRFVKLFEMIGDLYSLPKYGELDLTPYFAPFYVLFFGFCLGDAGYGLLLLLLGFIFVPRTKGATKNAMQLSKWLGLSTILFGLIGGTLFGLNLYDQGWGFYGSLNEMLKAQGKGINDHLFNLALLLGVIQVLFGMVLKSINEMKQFGFRYAVGTFGWLTLFVGLIASFALDSFGVSAEMVSYFRYGVLGVWALASLVFNNPDRSIFANIGAGVWDSYNMATGVMGDILSYIRLFALGISSSILGFVFNTLAVQFAPENIIGKIIVMTIILVIGHGLNLFMGILGSFVHPVRLTFVEFYKNSGFTGGGVRYNPFKKRS